MMPSLEQRMELCPNKGATPKKALLECKLAFAQLRPKYQRREDIDYRRIINVTLKMINEALDSIEKKEETDEK